MTVNLGELFKYSKVAAAQLASRFLLGFTFCKDGASKRSPSAFKEDSRLSSPTNSQPRSQLILGGGNASVEFLTARRAINAAAQMSSFSG
jgi:hypothetical protein